MNTNERMLLLSETEKILHRLGTDNLKLMKELADILFESERDNLPF